MLPSQFSFSNFFSTFDNFKARLSRTATEVRSVFDPQLALHKSTVRHKVGRPNKHTNGRAYLQNILSRDS